MSRFAQPRAAIEASFGEGTEFHAGSDHDSQDVDDPSGNDIALAKTIDNAYEDGPSLSEWLLSIYEAGFETIFGSWMGKYSNPFFFGEGDEADLCVSIRETCIQLDKWMVEDGHSINISGSPAGSSPDFNDNASDRSLQHAIEAYAVRWLPLVKPSLDARNSGSKTVQHLWRQARKDMLKVINRPCYRSTLALLLFALTPIPAGISDEEELDGVSGQVCVHAALQQIQMLRARQKSLLFNGARVELVTPNVMTSNKPALSTTAFMNAESAAYWAALTFDTSASLTLSCRPLLSSGLFGCELETCWKMVRSHSKVFRETALKWNASGQDMTDEMANQVIAAASTWKLLLWKLTANFKESLRDGYSDPEVKRAFETVSTAIDEFDAVYKSLLIACYNRIHFFAQETKFRWYELTLHYHLCILMLVDIAEATERTDLLTEFSTKQLDAESWVMNCLKFGLTNRYIIGKKSRSQYGDMTTISYDFAEVTTLLVAIDPYAHHVVAAVKLIHRAITRDFNSGRLSAAAYQDLLTTLTETLSHLPQGSKSIQIARASVLSQTASS